MLASFLPLNDGFAESDASAPGGFTQSTLVSRSTVPYRNYSKEFGELWKIINLRFTFVVEVPNPPDPG
ncbi:MAG: hypothetical protein ACLP56_05650, partial [Candidatus Sulfotelmatobacter sp.]